MVKMFSNIEKANRKKFIALYEEFLDDPLDKEIKKKAEGMGIIGNPQFSKELNVATLGAYKIELGNLKIDEAKKILEDLKK